MLLTSETRYKQVGLTLHFYCNEIDFFFLICQWFFSPSGRYHGCQKFLISLTLNSNLWTFFPAWMIVNLALLGLLLLFKYQRRQSCRTLIVKNRSEQRSVFRQNCVFSVFKCLSQTPQNIDLFCRNTGFIKVWQWLGCDYISASRPHLKLFLWTHSGFWPKKGTEMVKLGCEDVNLIKLCISRLLPAVCR